MLDLDRSYLAVHGPPGCGKTYTAARVIAALVNEHGWRVGVVAQSHSVVENLFDEIVAAGVGPGRVAKKRERQRGPWDRLKSKAYPAFLAEGRGCVIGGTAWDFANPGNRVLPGSLDLLVIEEAGQFCLAQHHRRRPGRQKPAATGDPQQLPQVSQGTHAGAGR